MSGLQHDTLLTASEVVAELKKLGITRTIGTLAKLRLRGGGPPFHRFGRDVRYPASELERWIAEMLSPAVRRTKDLRELAGKAE